MGQNSGEAGNLKQTPQCHCVIQTSGEAISILPAEPQAVCVPVYSPVVYGAWPYPGTRPFRSRYPPDSPTSQGSGSALDRPFCWPLLVRSGGGVGSIGGIATSPSTPLVSCLLRAVAPRSRAMYGCMTRPTVPASPMATPARERASMLRAFRR